MGKRAKETAAMFSREGRQRRRADRADRLHDSTGIADRSVEAELGHPLLDALEFAAANGLEVIDLSGQDSIGLDRGVDAAREKLAAEGHTLRIWYQTPMPAPSVAASSESKRGGESAPEHHGQLEVGFSKVMV
jgi:hypothetical protein